MIIEYILVLICSLGYAYCTYEYLLKLNICTSNRCAWICAWCIWINPYIYKQLYYYPLKNMQSMLLLLLFFNQVLQYKIKQIISKSITLLLMIFYPIAAIPILILYRYKYHLLVLIILIIIINNFGIYQPSYTYPSNVNIYSWFYIHYKQTYFPNIFIPQLNLMWIMSAHMFIKYLQLYQYFFIVIALVSVYPLINLPLSLVNKFVVIIFIQTYVSYHCSIIQILILTLVYMSIAITIKNISHKQYEQLLLKSLCTIHSIGSISFVIINKVILQIYQTTYLLNIGYVFLFLVILYIINIIYLVEIIQLHLNSLPEYGSKINRFKKYIESKIYK